ncbi:hypothetical protein ACJ73_07691 [Blastomyces percursus]|uniref:JmjC domain-containing protein n=1 Tax=Blastomyces percursus TaxID=1658174 RepID=A0A1J9PYJ3_9EURO|nr:hypothetical protein ACJ73_07691 [Blastomyces percursus]
MSRPTKQDLDCWISDPHTYTGGPWRYVVLRPGQTIFFTSGTIHYVFRLSGDQTLIFGGHILQWSNIDQWMKVIIAQIKDPDITNEDMKSSVENYVNGVVDLVHEKRNISVEGHAEGQGNIGNLDEETISSFLENVKIFHSLKAAQHVDYQ